MIDRNNQARDVLLGEVDGHVFRLHQGTVAGVSAQACTMGLMPTQPALSRDILTAALAGLEAQQKAIDEPYRRRSVDARNGAQEARTAAEAGSTGGRPARRDTAQAHEDECRGSTANR